MSVKCWASVAGAGQYPFSPSQYFMLAGARAHSAWRAAADSEMEVSAYFTSVHIPSFGSTVTSNAADSEMEVSAYFTSVLIPTFGRAVTGKIERSDASEKEVYTGFTSEHIWPFGNTVTRMSEMNGTYRLSECHRQHFADRGKATCPHLCVQRGDIIKQTANQSTDQPTYQWSTDK